MLALLTEKAFNASYWHLRPSIWGVFMSAVGGFTRKSSLSGTVRRPPSRSILGLVIPITARLFVRILRFSIRSGCWRFGAKCADI
jgi:hypothetical protein